MIFLFSLSLSIQHKKNIVKNIILPHNPLMIIKILYKDINYPHTFNTIFFISSSGDWNSLIKMSITSRV